jgi:hypothetical protein
MVTNAACHSQGPCASPNLSDPRVLLVQVQAFPPSSTAGEPLLRQHSAHTVAVAVQKWGGRPHSAPLPGETVTIPPSSTVW